MRRFRLLAIVALLGLLGCSGNNATVAPQPTAPAPAATAPQPAAGAPEPSPSPQATAPKLVRTFEVQETGIRADFAPDAYTTTYLFNAFEEIRGTSDPKVAQSVAKGLSAHWAGPNCGTWAEAPTEVNVGQGFNGSGMVTYSHAFVFKWSHPHPPCGATTSHNDVTILLGVTDGTETYLCTYDGAESGIGAPCRKQ